MLDLSHMSKPKTKLRWKEHVHHHLGKVRPRFVAAASLVGLLLLSVFSIGYLSVLAMLGGAKTVEYARTVSGEEEATSTAAGFGAMPKATIDIAAYNKKLLQLANYKTPIATTTMSGTGTSTLATSTVASHRPWPAKAAIPLPGALLPFNRIVAYYGNFYSTGMGVLGEYPESQVLAMLASTTDVWRRADPTTPVIPAIDYIAVTAQGSPGADGKYRARMPDSQIDKALEMARSMNGIVILEVQPGLSNMETEVPLLEKYLKMPNVELALDPEFSMEASGLRPEAVIGTLDATNINFAVDYLANLVTTYNLPPKILIVHRFTQDMVTHYRQIKTVPQVQFVLDMDGWGSQAKKIGTYTNVIAAEPIQFTGFKLFYKNDIRPPSTGMLTPAQVLNLTPQPSFIQYQ